MKSEELWALLLDKLEEEGRDPLAFLTDERRRLLAIRQLERQREAGEVLVETAKAVSAAYAQPMAAAQRAAAAFGEAAAGDARLQRLWSQPLYRRDDGPGATATWDEGGLVESRGHVMSEDGNQDDSR